MANQKSIDKYHFLFPTDKEKAKAFDQIAEKYYYNNFGSTAKSDIDILMFSIYIDRILEINENDISAYSDYSLSKLLGITQSKISNLKVKKELIYPYNDFGWKDAFLRIANRAIYEDGKIKLFIPDKNLYLEIKNAIEEAGGFIEIQLTPNLLQLNLTYFLDLMISIEEKENRTEIIKAIAQRTKPFTKDKAIINRPSFGKVLSNCASETIMQLIENCLPFFKTTKNIAQSLFNSIKPKGE